MKPMGIPHPASSFNVTGKPMRDKLMRLRVPNQQGFTLIEMVLAFFVLAIMALAALPLMAMGLRLSSQATVTTAANQRVQQTIELARIAPVTCAALQGRVGTTTYNDGRGNNFRVAVSLPTGCTSSVNAQSIPVRVVATRTRDGVVLTDVITRIFVAGS